MNDSSALARALDLLRAGSHLVLATSGPQGPHASLMAYVLSADGREVALAMGADSRKWANLEAEPRVSLLVDDRVDRLARGAGAVSALTVSGRVLPPGDEAALARARAELLLRHPGLAVFLAAPDGRVVRIRVLAVQLLAGPTESFFHRFES